MIVCKCGRRFTRFVWPIYCACGRVLRSPDDAMAYDDLPPWPMWAKCISHWRSSNDQGVGDTVKRIADALGGQAFRAVATWLGIPCGCTVRQARWNAQFPYGSFLEDFER